MRVGRISQRTVSIRTVGPATTLPLADVLCAEWAELRPRLEPTVREKQEERLEEDERALKTLIVQTYEIVYEAALGWMAPAQRYLCPSVGFLRSNIRGAWDLMQVCFAKKDEEDMLLQITIPGLMVLLQDYIDERKKKVTRTSTVQEAEDALSLARNVYFCVSSLVFTATPGSRTLTTFAGEQFSSLHFYRMALHGLSCPILGE